MPVVKICPSCGFQNDIQSSMCDSCLADISGINPVNTDTISDAPVTQHADTQVPNDASATVIERKRFLTFKASDGSGSFSVSSGAIVGREAEGREYLASHMTVSRRHARLNFNGSWLIEDLDSSNGTFVNEIRIAPKEPHNVKNGDSVALSRSCVFTVEE